MNVVILSEGRLTTSVTESHARQFGTERSSLRRQRRLVNVRALAENVVSGFFRVRLLNELSFFSQFYSINENVHMMHGEIKYRYSLYGSVDSIIYLYIYVYGILLFCIARNFL